jgi:hypothetical protein
MTNEKVSNEYVLPDVFILPNTQIHNERQVEFRPMRHSEEV